MSVPTSQFLMSIFFLSLLFITSPIIIGSDRYSSRYLTIKSSRDQLKRLNLKDSSLCTMVVER